MAKPLRSDDPRPQSVQFAHFGVLNDGKRSKGAAATSIVINGLILLIIVLLGLVVKSNPKMAKQLTELTLPPEPPPPPAVKRPPPPPPPKPLPPTPKITPPKAIEPPPPEIKPIEVPIPKPVVTAPAPPKAVTPPPAPVKVNLANNAAAIKNNDLKPSAVRLGNETNPLANVNGPAVSRVNMGNAGAAGMNANNTGSGPRATSVVLGQGNPNGTNMNGRGPGNQQIAGVKLGTTGATGPVGSHNYTNQQVSLGNTAVAAAANRPTVASLTAAAPPKVLYKPAPVYTAEAKSLHLEGNVSVKIKVLSSGTVQVEAITHSLGHGLDESAKQAILGTRFKPAVDANGHPVDWEGVVQVNFQLS